MNSRTFHKPVRCAFSLAETVMSTLLVSLLMVVSMNSFAHVVSVANRDTYKLTATELSQLYLAEITSKCFEDPDAIGSGVLGKETEEVGQLRSVWDDCDDYASLSLSTLTDASGNAIPGTSGWGASFQVVHSDPNSPTTVSGTKTDMKLITLNLTDPKGTTRTFLALRSKFGALQDGQPNNILSSTKIRLETSSDSWNSGTRILNQQAAP